MVSDNETSSKSCALEGNEKRFWLLIIRYSVWLTWMLGMDYSTRKPTLVSTGTGFSPHFQFFFFAVKEILISRSTLNLVSERLPLTLPLSEEEP
jgi:hypothetical protein